MNVFLVSVSCCFWHLQNEVPKLPVVSQLGRKAKGTLRTGGEKGKGRGSGVDEALRSF